MKITKEHYNEMKKRIEPFKNLIKERREYLQTEKNVMDIEKRLRWDLYHIARLDKFTCDNLYSYCNDYHIDTALKAIMKELDQN
jgi:hypothetical protein